MWRVNTRLLLKWKNMLAVLSVATQFNIAAKEQGVFRLPRCVEIWLRGRTLKPLKIPCISIRSICMYCGKKRSYCMLSIDCVISMQCYVLHKSGKVAMPCAIKTSQWNRVCFCKLLFLLSYAKWNPCHTVFLIWIYTIGTGCKAKYCGSLNLHQFLSCFKNI